MLFLEVFMKKEIRSLEFGDVIWTNPKIGKHIFIIVEPNPDSSFENDKK